MSSCTSSSGQATLSSTPPFSADMSDTVPLAVFEPFRAARPLGARMGRYRRTVHTPNIDVVQRSWTRPAVCVARLVLDSADPIFFEVVPERVYRPLRALVFSGLARLQRQLVVHVVLELRADAPSGQGGCARESGRRRRRRLVPVTLRLENSTHIGPAGCAEAGNEGPMDVFPDAFIIIIAFGLTGSHPLANKKAYRMIYWWLA